SQVLIITVWHDARWGTVTNLIILLAAIPAYANSYFQRSVSIETRKILGRIPYNDKTIVTPGMISSLPPVVQQWLMHSGIVGKPRAYMVRLTQSGTMRIKPSGKWVPFDAEEYFTPQVPAYIWNASIRMNSLLYLNGRDKFVDGYGSMLIKALSFVNVANKQPGQKINESSMLRFLAEISFFPSAALCGYIHWEQIDSHSAKAIMTYKDVTVQGIFHFTANGNINSFTADRYMDTGDAGKPEKWVIENLDFKEMNGICIPCQSKITWELSTGNFHWLNLKITNLEVNRQDLYKSVSVNSRQSLLFPVKSQFNHS
ncbi:MAG: DUF6544 family protein, partial [Chitinophagaceae bacterium]